MILQNLINLKKKGNEYRIKISEFEEKKRILDKQIQEEILIYQIYLAKMRLSEKMKIIMSK